MALSIAATGTLGVIMGFSRLLLFHSCVLRTVFICDKLIDHKLLYIVTCRVVEISVVLVFLIGSYLLSFGTSKFIEISIHGAEAVVIHTENKTDRVTNK